MAVSVKVDPGYVQESREGHGWKPSVKPDHKGPQG